MDNKLLIKHNFTKPLLALRMDSFFNLCYETLSKTQFMCAKVQKYAFTFKNPDEIRPKNSNCSNCIAVPKKDLSGLFFCKLNPKEKYFRFFQHRLFKWTVSPNHTKHFLKRFIAT